MCSLSTVFLMILQVSAIFSQSCSEFETCGECIGNPLHCVWCSDKEHQEPRCVSSDTFKTAGKSWCKAPADPKTSRPKLSKNKPLVSNKDPTKSVQFRPQAIDIKIRPGDTVHFNMEYKPALAYPIDVYYLMDNSFTMLAHKNALRDQAQAIYTKLSKLSNNVRFGVGTFIEKLALPFGDLKYIHELDTFTNRLSLTDEIDKLIQVVDEVKHSSNFDIPESALDALMQVMACTETIDWTREARRMIILSTDAPYHSAGDGKMVGAYKPNDMKCHLTNNTYGTDASLLYDYPSVSQISKVATEKQISITFAVLKGVEKEYKALAEKIELASYVELRTGDNTTKGSDLVDLIEKEYLQLAQSLEIDRGAVPSHFELNITPSCDKTNKCNVTSGSSIKLEASLKVIRCPTNGKFKETLQIGPNRLREKLMVNVEVICECDCEKGQKKKSPTCNGGTLQCGVCKCNSNTYGQKCQCKGTSTEQLDRQKCKANLNDTVLCSGRGDCGCGDGCQCWDVDSFEGPLCQYKKNDCPIHENKVCGGNGRCKFNVCHCGYGWNGTDCSCTSKTDACIGANSKTCSGNGECRCGGCVCKENKFSGKYCHEYDNYAEDRCKELEDYVQCNYDGDKTACDKKFDVRNNRTVILLDRTEIKDQKWRQTNWCRKILGDYSSIQFKYLDGNNSTLILIQKEKELPPEANIWIPIGSAIGTILLIGILSVIAWKVLVDIHDAREYKKFVQESADAGYDISNNPLYQPPAININNPAYTGKF